RAALRRRSLESERCCPHWPRGSRSGKRQCLSANPATGLTAWRPFTGGYLNFMNHEGHEVTQRIECYIDFLRVPSCPPFVVKSGHYFLFGELLRIYNSRFCRW